MTTPTVIRPAATILLLREAPGLEVLMVRRNQEVDFMSGAMVFPGGKVDEGDFDPAWQAHATGWAGIADAERGPRVAAIREAFEETGILLASGGAMPDAQAAVADRKAIERGALPFLAYIAGRGLTVHPDRLTLFSRWLAPSIAPKRFDTFFFIAEAPEGQAAVHDGHETVETEWVAPDEALRLAGLKQRTIVFPTRMNLGMLARTRTVAEAVSAALRRPPRTVEPRVELRGTERVLILDPDLGYGHVEEPFFIPTRPSA